MSVDNRADIGPAPKDFGKVKTKSAEKMHGKGANKALRVTLATGALLGTAWVGNATATELTDNAPFLNNPAYTTQYGPVQKAEYDVLHPLDWIKNIKSVAPSEFSNLENNGNIGNNNIITITDIKQIDDKKTFPTVPTAKNDISLLAPFQNFLNNQDAIYSKAFGGDSGFGYKKDIISNAQQEGIKDAVDFNDLPIGTVIVAPADGLIRFGARQSEADQGNIEIITLTCTAPDGEIYQINLGPDNPLKSLIDFKPRILEGPLDQPYLTMEVKRGQPIAKTLQATKLSVGCFIWTSGEIGKETPGKWITPANVNFITLPDNQGKDKLAVLAK